MVSSGPQDSDFPGLVDCVMFFDKTHYSHSASLHSVMYIGTGKCKAGGNAVMDYSCSIHSGREEKYS